MQETLEVYLERLKHYGYTEEELQGVIEFRKEAEHVPWEQYRMLIDQQLLKRTRKLKKIRNVYFYDEKFWILDHYHKKYNWIGFMHTDEFLEERRLKEEEAKRIVAENRAKKKAEKQAQQALAQPKKTAVEAPKAVKPKRKRI